MHVDLEKVIQLISSPSDDLSDSNKDFLYSDFRMLLKLKNEIPSEKLETLCNLFLNALEKSSGFTKTLLASFLFHIYKAPDFLHIAWQGITEQDYTVETAMAEIYALKRTLFTSTSDEKKLLAPVVNRQNIHTLYINTLLELQTTITKQNINISQHMPSNNKVVLLTCQFLTLTHAPTKSILEIAKILQCDFNKDVLIINTCELSKNFKASFLTNFQPDCLDEYSDIKNINYEGNTFKFFQPPKGDFSQESQIALIAEIEKFDPSLMLANSSLCLTAELFSNRSYVVQLPLSVELPITLFNNFLLYVEPNTTMLDDMKREKIEKNLHFVQNFIVEHPTLEGEFTRSEKGLPEGKFIFATVGYRLPEECNDEYWKMLDEICAESDSHMLILGPYLNLEKTIAHLPALSANITHIEFEANILAMYELCDAYLCPERLGGGTSAVYALYAKLPVLSLPVGDTQLASNIFPEISTYEEMKQVAIKITRDIKMLENYKSIAAKGQKNVTTRKQFIGKILERHALMLEDLI